MKPLRTMPRWYLPLLLSVFTPLLTFFCIMSLLLFAQFMIWSEIHNLDVATTLENLRLCFPFLSALVSVPCVLWLDYLIRDMFFRDGNNV